MTAPADSPGRVRAAAALGVPPQADEETARAAFLRRLPGEGFVPPESAAAAANALAATDLPLTANGRGDADSFWAAEVAAFVREFWSLTPAARRVWWDTLQAGVDSPAIEAQLRRLEPGLDVPAVAHADPGADELAGLVRELFLLPPRVRALRRVRWLAEEAPRFGALVAASRIVLKDDMPTARLDPKLFHWFAAKHTLKPTRALFELTPEETAAATERAKAEFVERMEADPPDETLGWQERDVRNAKWIFRIGCGGVAVFFLVAWLLTVLQGYFPTPTPPAGPITVPLSTSK